MTDPIRAALEAATAAMLAQDTHGHEMARACIVVFLRALPDKMLVRCVTSAGHSYSVSLHAPEMHGIADAIDRATDAGTNPNTPPERSGG